MGAGPQRRGEEGIVSEQAQKRSERIQLMLDVDELEAIDAWRFENRLPSRAAALRELIRRGLMNRGLEPPDTRSSKDHRFQRHPPKRLAITPRAACCAAAGPEPQATKARCWRDGQSSR
jgi:hypothetical protein